MRDAGTYRGRHRLDRPDPYRGFVPYSYPHRWRDAIVVIAFMAVTFVAYLAVVITYLFSSRWS